MAVAQAACFRGSNLNQCDRFGSAARFNHQMMRNNVLKWLLGWVSPIATPGAFAELYGQTHLLVFRYVYGMHGGPVEDVEDLTAEIYLRAWRARDQFEGDAGAAVGWLLVIARNQVVDAHRRQNVQGVSEPLDDDSLPAPEPSPEAQAGWAADVRTFWVLAQGLPVAQREMLILRYLQGWQVQAIAAHLGLTDNAVSLSLRRALKRLRADWPKELGA
jgi:RNA polymerase sigma-70 factor, ECF subfamily